MGTTDEGPGEIWKKQNIPPFVEFTSAVAGFLDLFRARFGSAVDLLVVLTHCDNARFMSFANSRAQYVDTGRGKTRGNQIISREGLSQILSGPDFLSCSALWVPTFFLLTAKCSRSRIF
jgi:hypothetical protein